ncbi:MAG: NAD(P)-dependent oxidoreductase [Clostridia bacterium]|nr:NAD(P)-dependent oxidoreductase [Clostridia bacterium]
MKILVTGSNGFIGSNLCRYLKKQGCGVIGLDLAPASRIDAVDEYVECDLSTEKTAHILDGRQVDALVHLAADMRHAPYEIDVVRNNCVGEQRLLELCEERKVPVFVQLSSLPVIGRPVEHPITEKHPLHPPTVYHATKRMMELLADYAFYTHGLRTVSFRICAPVGVGMNQKTIFPTFIRNALAAQDIVLFGKGTRQQTYIHVNDIAQAIYKTILNEKAQGVYNLGSYNLLSNKDLARKCVETLRSDSKIVFNGQPDPMDGDVWDVSIDRVKEDTGYEPAVSIEEAILEQAEALRRQ